MSETNEYCEALTELFQDYKDSNEPDLSDIVLPKQIEAIEIEWMIYQLCKNDITKKKWVEENLDITDYVEFMCLKKYDNYLESESIKRSSEKYKR